MIHSYVKPGEKRPYPLVADNLSIGFSNIKIAYANGKLTCEFSRAKSMPGVNNYFDINKFYYLLFAHGTINSSGNFLIFSIANSIEKNLNLN